MLYNVKITTVTPIHIGASKENDLVRGLDYIQQGNQVYVIDRSKLLKLFTAAELADLIYKNKLEARLINDFNLDEISETIYYLPDGMALGDMEISQQVRNKLTNRPIIPGSSLKGAVRTVLLNYFIQITQRRPKDERDIAKFFGNPSDGNDFMRFLKFADIEFADTDLYPVKTFSLDKDKQGGWKHKRINGTSQKFSLQGFIIPVEAIAPDQEAQTTIKIEKEYFDWFNKLAERELQQARNANKKPQFRPTPSHTRDIMQNDPFKTLCQIINTYTKNYISKELAYHSQYNQADYSETIIDVYQWLLDQIPENNTACLLRVGFGLGFHAITGDWQYRDHIKTGFWKGGYNAGKPRWKTRKFIAYEYETETGDKALDFLPFGFVKLQLTD